MPKRHLARLVVIARRAPRAHDPQRPAASRAQGLGGWMHRRVASLALVVAIPLTATRVQAAVTADGRDTPSMQVRPAPVLAPVTAWSRLPALPLVPFDIAPSTERKGAQKAKSPGNKPKRSPSKGSRKASASASSAASKEGKGSATRTASARRRTSRTVRRSVKAVPVLRPTSPRGEIALANDLNVLLNARTVEGAWGVVVASISRGDTLFAYRPDAPMLPASTFKLFTTALAFDRLGPSHQIGTDILRDGPVDADGTLRGSLILRGGGDPSMSSRYVQGGAESSMRSLARMVADAGIKRVSGDVIGDDGAFERKPIPDGWLSRYLHDSYAARVSSLSLNENLLNVVIAPGKAGGTGVVSLQPATVAYKVVNNTRTAAGRASRLTVSRTSDGTIVARGTIGARSGPKVYQVVVDDPALFTTGAFRKALEREGISVDGSLRLGATPDGATKVATLRSPPLWALANDMNRESVNHIAELLLRNASRTGAPDGVGSAERANHLLRDFMSQKVGARPEAVNAADGSGLSTMDRITPRALVQLLSYANRASWGREFHESLPVAGQSETLRRRMIATPAAGNLHAKTGTTAEVISLGGYVTAANGELLAFSFLYNGRDRWRARETI
ncbi:MAG TPA: D-alanyl-D-alanine carboxypeptidase/D-alanyl-D-alanine-endopeptidase, partial [Gemmatimonadaceae bacterium]|nr:D-alanyl-D-alanine carboxypeptidase/D-alanyl-D-alanine-endopeptidase [Gemmatimonadaceae bacterium]